MVPLKCYLSQFICSKILRPHLRYVHNHEPYDDQSECQGIEIDTIYLNLEDNSAILEIKTSHQYSVTRMNKLSADRFSDSLAHFTTEGTLLPVGELESFSIFVEEHNEFNFLENFITNNYLKGDIYLWKHIESFFCPYTSDYPNCSYNMSDVLVALPYDLYPYHCPKLFVSDSNHCDVLLQFPHPFDSAMFAGRAFNDTFIFHLEPISLVESTAGYSYYDCVEMFNVVTRMLTYFPN